MSRLLVVSRNTYVALALSTEHHDVTDARPDRDSTWLGEVPGVDAALLDLEDPYSTAETLLALRRHGLCLPVVVIRDAVSGWDALESQRLPSVGWVSVPVSASALVAAVERALSAGPAAAELPPQVQESLLRLALLGTPANSADLEPPGQSPPGPSDSEDFGGHPEAEAPHPPRPAPTASSLTSLRAHLSPPAAEQAPTPEATAPDPAGIELVRRLLPHSADLTGVPETAHAIALEARERSSAEAGCVLVADGFAWRLAAGFGMTEAESLLELPEDHWLIRTMIGSRGGFSLSLSDRARPGRAKLRLDRFDQLFAMSIPDGHGVILLARSTAFSASELNAISWVAEEAAPLLDAALDVRRLARALARHTDDPKQVD